MVNAYSMGSGETCLIKPVRRTRLAAWLVKCKKPCSSKATDLGFNNCCCPGLYYRIAQMTSNNHYGMIFSGSLHTTIHSIQRGPEWCTRVNWSDYGVQTSVFPVTSGAVEMAAEIWGLGAMIYGWCENWQLSQMVIRKLSNGFVCFWFSVRNQRISCTGKKDKRGRLVETVAKSATFRW